MKFNLGRISTPLDSHTQLLIRGKKAHIPCHTWTHYRPNVCVINSLCRFIDVSFFVVHNLNTVGLKLTEIRRKETSLSLIILDLEKVVEMLLNHTAYLHMTTVNPSSLYLG